MKDLVEKVIKWGEEKGILKNSTPEKQFLKTMEKVGELAKAIGKNDLEEIKGAIGDVAVTLILLNKMTSDDLIYNLESIVPFGRNHILRITEDLGDIVVFLEIKNLNFKFFTYPLSNLEGIANERSLTLEECLQSAYNKISKLDGERGGKIDE